VPFGGSNGLVWLFPFHTRGKYCHNGGMAFAPNQIAASSRPGVRDRDHGPFRWSPENDWFAGKKAAEAGGRCPLGAAMDSSGSHRAQVLPQRGMTSATKPVRVDGAGWKLQRSIVGSQTKMRRHG